MDHTSFKSDIGINIAQISKRYRDELSENNKAVNKGITKDIQDLCNNAELYDHDAFVKSKALTNEQMAKLWSLPDNKNYKKFAPEDLLTKCIAFARDIVKSGTVKLDAEDYGVIKNVHETFKKI